MNLLTDRCTNGTTTGTTTMATQLNNIAIRVEETKKPVDVPSNLLENSNYANSISRPFFKIESVPPKDQDSFTQALSNNSLTNQISAQIKALDLQSRSTSCLDKTCVLADIDTSTSENDVENFDESEEESLNVISKVFEDETPLAINKIRHWNPSISRNFYTRPTPLDLQYEEQGSFVTNAFDR